MTKKIDIPLTQTFAYLEVNMLVRAITENFDVKPKKDSEHKDVMVFTDNKLLDNRKNAIELFKS